MRPGLCALQFTSKLESMFTDIKTSRDTMNEFRSKLADSGRLGELHGIDLQVQVRPPRPPRASRTRPLRPAPAAAPHPSEPPAKPLLKPTAPS